MLALCIQSSGFREKEMLDAGTRFGKAHSPLTSQETFLRTSPLGDATFLRRFGAWLPVPDLLDKGNMDLFRPLMNTYIMKAEEHLLEAVRYIQMLPHRQYRLRKYVHDPSDHRAKDSELLKTENVLDGDNRIKVSRSEIRGIIRKVVLSIPSKRMSTLLP